MGPMLINFGINVIYSYVLKLSSVDMAKLELVPMCNVDIADGL